MPDTHYDVIIIGGRCAGASLAIRLAQSNINVLLVDRATFPSTPNVPSAPFIHTGTMRLLDELGLDEADYAHIGGRVERFVADFPNGIVVEMNIPSAGLDRDHFYGVDRQYFDNALWQHAASFPTVTGCDGFAVTKINSDSSGKMIGIVGKSGDTEETFTADLIVGADGRYSFTAREVNAQVIEERNKHTGAVYTAEWDNVDEHSPDYPNAITTYNNGKGLLILVVPMDERKYHIGVATKTADANFGDTSHEDVYLQRIQIFPNLWNRLKYAERTSTVVGMKRIENGYRQAYGDGWALVGDALHYKDPADGQGIYDALLGSKLLAQSIVNWKTNSTTWQIAGAQYQKQFTDATFATFEQTVANLKQSLYTNVPDILFKVMVNGMMNDPTFKTNFLLYLAREISPKEFQKIMRKIPIMMAKGVWSEVRGRVT